MTNIYVSSIFSKGRGIKSSNTFIAGDLIEIAPVIVLDSIDSWKYLEKTNLKNYYFVWGEENIAIACGYVSLYNHSYTPNARYIKYLDKQQIEIIAITTILPHQEILVNYNEDPNCKD